jgi:uncharacterized protein (TIRG00374 family)
VTNVLRRWLRLLLGLAVASFFLWLLLRQLDLAEIGVTFSRISVPPLLLALCFLGAGYTMRVVRWWWMLRVLEPHVPLGACGWPFLVSIAVNNLLPFRAGDVLRVIGFRQQLRSPYMRLLATLVIERLLDLITLVAFFSIGLLGVVHGKIPETFIWLTTSIVVGGAIIVIAILLFSQRMARLVYWIAERPCLAERGWSKHIQRHGSHFLDALGLLRTPTLTLQLIGMSIFVWGLEGAVFAILAEALDAKTSLAGSWFALATGTLATLLPSSPGYVGTFDYFAMLGLMAYGADHTTAAAFAVAVHVVLWLPITVLGLTYFLRADVRILTRRAVAAVPTTPGGSS